MTTTDRQQPPEYRGEVHVVHVLGALRRSGAEIMLISAADTFRSLGIRTTIMSMSPAHDSTATELFDAVGYEVVHVGREGRVASVMSYRRAIADIRPDCVHVHLENLSIYSMTTARLFRLPVIRTVHSAFDFTRHLRLRSIVQRKIARMCGIRFVAISASVQRNERERFLNSSTLIPNWYDAARFRPPTADERQAARDRLGCSDRVAVALVGNCSEIKQHTLLLSALAQIPPEHRPLVLHVGAPGEPDSEASLARDLGITDSVTFLGSIDDVAHVLHAADAFAMPSRYEGLGLAALEAAATGLPLMLSDAPGLRDLAELGDGITLIQQTPSAWAQTLATLTPLSSDEPRRLGLARRVADTYGMVQSVQRYIDLYRNNPSGHCQ